MITKKRIASYSVTKGENLLTGNKARDLRLPRNIVFDLRNIIRILVLLTSDIAAISLGWYVPQTDYIQTFLLSSQSGTNINVLLPSIILIAIFLLSACQGYARGAKSRNPIGLFKAITLTYLAVIPIVGKLYGSNSLSQLFWTWAIALVLLAGFRLIIFQLLLYLRQQYFPLKINVMLIGEGKDLEKCLPLLEKSKEFKICTQIDLSEFDDCDRALDTALEQFNPKQMGEILICSWEKIKDSKQFLWQLRGSGIYWRILKLDERINANNLEISQFEGITALRINDPPIIGIDFLSKRIFDLVFSLILLAILSLPMLAIALLIKLDSPGPIFYRQTRLGLKGTHFQVWKFRTMIQNANQLQQQLEAKNEVSGGVLFKIKADPRITKVGKFLRQYSLDELPQLFNVLRGEMSLVGPRPLPIRDTERFAPEHFFRQEVLPGITGLWQVSGRSNTDSENVFNLDFEYIQNWSLALDFKILLQTIAVVLNKTGAY
jgi:exopolysaccharide biosynthesis polyprenyl glycosylphosphotransferase